MQTISGPVGRSRRYEAHNPRADATAPETHEMIASRRKLRVNRNAIAAGTTRNVKTISTPPTGTENVITTPNER